MSSYSTNLKIELIGTGQQAGTWGNTTNTNLGTLIEQAIAGYESYPCTGGTDTLTMAEGASSTARNMFIRLSGTGGGTLVVPGTSPNANTKLYFIYNNTASGAVTVKVSGQTGVSVPNGASSGNQRMEYLDNCSDWLIGLHEIVIATDGDAAGESLG